MKKKQLVTIGLLILTVLLGIYATFPSFWFSVVVGLILLALLFLLPFLALYKNKAAISIVAVCLMLCGLVDILLVPGVSILKNACYICFGTMALLWALNDFKSKLIYIPGIIVIVVNLYDCIAASIHADIYLFLLPILWDMLVPLTLIATAYILLHENIHAPKNDKKTNFTYLDEYKRNMKK